MEYKNDLCVIICNGPSLNDVPDSFLDQYYTIGSNRVFLRYIPDLLAVVDVKMVHSPELQLDMMQAFKMTPEVVISKDVKGYFQFDDLGEHVHVTEWKNVFDDDNQLMPAFSNYPYKMLVSGGTVTYCAFQIGMAKGYNKFLMVGLDHTFVGPNGDHFSEEYNSPVGIPYNLEPQERWGMGHGNWYFSEIEFVEKTTGFYEVAKGIIEDTGGWVKNLTPETKLEVFDVQNWREV